MTPSPALECSEHLESWIAMESLKIKKIWARPLLKATSITEEQRSSVFMGGPWSRKTSTLTEGGHRSLFVAKTGSHTALNTS